MENTATPTVSPMPIFSFPVLQTNKKYYKWGIQQNNMTNGKGMKKKNRYCKDNIARDMLQGIYWTEIWKPRSRPWVNNILMYHVTTTDQWLYKFAYWMNANNSVFYCNNSSLCIFKILTYLQLQFLPYQQCCTYLSDNFNLCLLTFIKYYLINKKQ